MVEFGSKFYREGVMLKQGCFATEWWWFYVWVEICLYAKSDILSSSLKLTVHCFLLQTRLADWKDGGLSSKFMFSRLKQASLELQQYEESAAPPGWKCVWDRWAWWKLNKFKQDHLPPLPHPNPPPQSYVRAHIHHSSYGRWYVTMVTMVTWHHVIIGCALLCEWGSVECEGKILFMCPKEIGLANKQRGKTRTW